jgi:hypothetical protein
MDTETEYKVIKQLEDKNTALLTHISENTPWNNEHTDLFKKYINVQLQNLKDNERDDFTKIYFSKKHFDATIEYWREIGKDHKCLDQKEYFAMANVISAEFNPIYEITNKAADDGFIVL